MLHLLSTRAHTYICLLLCAQSCFRSNDIIEHRYFDKRAIYVALLAKRLNAVRFQTNVDAPPLPPFQQSFSVLHNDANSPVIILRPIYGMYNISITQSNRSSSSRH